MAEGTTGAGTAQHRGRVPQGQVLLVACSGAFLAFLDATIVNVAFPSIRESFDDTSIGDLSWVLNAYNIVFAAFLVVFGRLADLLGRRRTFVWGVVVFTVASVACGLATSVEVLVAARVLQALGAALLVPASLALVVQAFPPDRRGHAIGLWGATAAVAAGLGPPAGGALVELGGWRWVFLINLPLGIAAVVAARRTLVESRAPGRRRLPDLRGAALLAAAVGGVNLAIVKGEDWGWTSLATTGTAVASLLLLGGFVLSSRHHRSPLLDPELLRIRSFSVANAATLLAGLGFFAYLLTNVLWLQYVWGYSVLRAGLALMPGALVAAVVATLVAPVAERRGARAVVVPGALVWAAAYAWYAQRAGLSPAFLTQWLPGQVLSGIGAGAVLPVLGSAAMAAVPGGRFATASAVVSSARQLGGVIGIAVLVVIVGVPTPQTVVGSLQDGWLLSIAAFVLVAVLALPLGRAVAPAAEVQQEEGDTPKVHLPAPASAQDGPADQARAGLGPVAVFAALSAQARARLDRTARTVTVAAGEVLLEEGDPADAVYVLQTGRLEVLVGGRVVRELAPGADLGELAVLTGGRRSATVRARRDATLLEVTAADFDALLLDDPAAARVVTAQLAQRLATPAPVRTARPARPSVVAVVPLHRGADAAAVAEALVAHLARTARVVQLDGATAEAVERAERDGALVVLAAAADDEAGRDFAVRQADQVVLVADASTSPAPVAVPRSARRPDLVLVGSRPAPDGLTAWSTALDPWQTTVVDGPVPAGVRALADRISGGAVGLVLAGGGARGFAHLGVLRELQEAGINVDRVAGCSIGAAIAAGHATGMSSDELEARGYQEWVRRRPFSDYTVPLVSLARGRRFEASLARCVGADTVIEGLPGQFRCVSTDLATRSRVVHDRGRLVAAVRASVGIPVLLPPVADGARLLVDGGVLDNLPVDLLTERDEGPVVAVNISMGGSGAPSSGTGRSGTPRRVRVPALGETLIRTMTIGSGGAVAAAREQGADVVTPATLGVGLLEFHQFDLMVEAGRAAARALLERTGGDLVAPVEPLSSTALPQPRVHAPAG